MDFALNAYLRTKLGKHLNVMTYKLSIYIELILKYFVIVEYFLS